MTDGPILLGRSLTAMKLCIPEGMTDAEVLAWAEWVDPSGTSAGWQVTPDPESIPANEGGGYPRRCPCDEVRGRVHVRINA